MGFEDTHWLAVTAQNRFRDTEIRASRGTKLTAKSWMTEAPLRMLMNNLDPEGMEDTATGKTVRVKVPLSEMFGYATDLRSQTQGRASYSMEFLEYAEAPSNVAKAVIEARGK